SRHHKSSAQRHGTRALPCSYSYSCCCCDPRFAPPCLSPFPVLRSCASAGPRQRVRFALACARPSLPLHHLRFRAPVEPPSIVHDTLTRAPLPPLRSCLPVILIKTLHHLFSAHSVAHWFNLLHLPAGIQRL